MKKAKFWDSKLECILGNAIIGYLPIYKIVAVRRKIRSNKTKKMMKRADRKRRLAPVRENF